MVQIITTLFWWNTESAVSWIWFIKVYHLVHAYYHTGLGRVEFFLWRDLVFWQKENLVLSFKMKMPKSQGFMLSKMTVKLNFLWKRWIKMRYPMRFSEAYALGQDGMWLTVYVRLSRIISIYKNRMEEKGGIVKKSKRQKENWDSNNYRDERKFFSLPNQFLTADAESEIIFHRWV